MGEGGGGKAVGKAGEGLELLLEGVTVEGHLGACDGEDRVSFGDPRRAVSCGGVRFLGLADLVKILLCFWVLLLFLGFLGEDCVDLRPLVALRTVGPQLEVLSTFKKKLRTLNLGRL